MHFDYYAATIPSSVTHCYNSILNHFPGSFIPEKPQRPFTQAVRHKEGGFRVYHGGVNPHPFFVASGDVAPEGAEFVRKVYPAHRVARADVAHDFIEVGGFDRMVGILDPIARAAGVTVTMVGDPSADRTTGRTMYFGAWSSDVRVYVYEKDKEQEAKGLPFKPGHVRVELRTKPRKDRKSRAATLTETGLWGLSAWTQRAVQEIDGKTVEYHPDRSMRKSTAERAVTHMIDQYGAAMRTFITEQSRDELLRRLAECWDAD